MDFNLRLAAMHSNLSQKIQIVQTLYTMIMITMILFAVDVMKLHDAIQIEQGGAYIKVELLHNLTVIACYVTGAINLVVRPTRVDSTAFVLVTLIFLVIGMILTLKLYLQVMIQRIYQQLAAMLSLQMPSLSGEVDRMARVLALVARSSDGRSRWRKLGCLLRLLPHLRSPPSQLELHRIIHEKFIGLLSLLHTRKCRQLAGRILTGRLCLNLAFAVIQWIST